MTTTKETLVRMPLAELVLDFGLYPRGGVDSQHVAYMREALDSGVTLPPIVADKKTKRISDGFHRFRAYEYQKRDTVEVLLKDYANEQEMLLDAIRLNSSHGHNLTAHDRVHCVILAERLSIPEEELASALHMEIEKLGELKIDRTGTMRVAGVRQPIALKRTIRHMAGRILTKDQSEANDHLSGMNQVFYVNQLIWLMESDLLNREDDKLIARLARLGELIPGYINVPQPV